MEDRRVVFLVMTILSGLSTGSNITAFQYISKTYDTSKSLYHILTLDSLVTFVCSLINFGASLFALIYLKREPISCFLTSFVAIGTFSQGLLTFFISLIRYKRISLNTPEGWRPDSQLKNVANWIVYVSVTYCCSVFLTNTVFQLGMSPMYNACILGNEAGPPNKRWAMIMLPVIIATLGSAILDFKSWRIIRNRHENVDAEIPFRASVISTILSIPSMLFPPAFMANFLQPLWMFLTIMILALGVMVIKNPLIVAFSFRVNQDIQQVNADEDRERRRQIEIQEALEKRNQRKKHKEEMKEPEDVMPPVEC